MLHGFTNPNDYEILLYRNECVSVLAPNLGDSDVIPLQFLSVLLSKISFFLLEKDKNLASSTAIVIRVFFVFVEKNTVRNVRFRVESKPL